MRWRDAAFKRILDSKRCGMQVSASTERALEYVDARASDVARAYTAGATPLFGDVGGPGTAQKDFDPMSVALPDDAYLVSRGDRRTSYTRDGALRLDEGTLCDSSGAPIVGFEGDNSAMGTLSVDPVDAALGRVRNARIEADGSLAYDRFAFDPLNGREEKERVVVGRVALARFPAATKLRMLDAIHTEPSQGVIAHVGRPGDGNFDRLSPMEHNGARIDFDRSLEKLHDAYVAFDAVAAAHKAQGNLGKTVMDLLK